MMEKPFAPSYIVVPILVANSGFVNFPPEARPQNRDLVKQMAKHQTARLIGKEGLGLKCSRNLDRPAGGFSGPRLTADGMRRRRS